MCVRKETSVACSTPIGAFLQCRRKSNEGDILTHRDLHEVKGSPWQHRRTRGLHRKQQN